MKLIYISNTRIPSEKANTYQSMVMCEAFTQYFDEVEFWYPQRNNTDMMKTISDPFYFYGIKKCFKLKKLFSMDLVLISKYSSKIWFLIQNISFALNYILQLNLLHKNNIILSRDAVGLYFLSIAKKLGFIKQKIYFEAHFYSKRIGKSAHSIDGLIVINHYLKELYEKDGIRNILVAHDGVKLDEYVNLSPPAPQQTKTVVYIGNLFEWKGVYTLADSVSFLPHQMHLIIVGGSDDTLPAFKRYVQNKHLKNIEVVGFVPKKETIQYIEMADVLVLPNSAKDKMSYYTSPLKLFEYMASNRPIVASKLPSLEEILANGKNAVLFEPDNPKDLAEKILFVLNNDSHHLAIQAYKDVQEYTWDKRAEKIIYWISSNNRERL